MGTRQIRAPLYPVGLHVRQNGVEDCIRENVCV